MITLMCGCKVNEDGSFIVGRFCVNCKECNTMPNIHPFGNGRLPNNS